MKKLLMLMLALMMIMLSVVGCSTPPSNPGDENPTPPIEEEEEIPPVWNVEPTVKGTPFFEDFSSGISTSIWEVCSQKWGAGNNGTSPANVFYSTNASRVAGEGATGGIAVLQSNGDYFETANRRRQGAALVTKRDFGPGLYEVRMKVVPRLGQCTAAWTYYSGGGTTKEDNKYSEIDIEMPIAGDYRKWAGTSYEYFAGWQVLAERGTVTVDVTEDMDDVYGVNDGLWHTYAFEWRTDKENDDNAVIWYMDGVEVARLNEYVPKYTATFWVGNWFPEDIGWVGQAYFESAYMYVDWIKITEYNDPVSKGANGGGGGTATDLGSAAIPQTNYISNRQLLRSGSEANSVLAWDIKSGTVTQGAQAELAGATKLAQIINGQYTGYAFDLEVTAQVTEGSGKLYAYVEYMFGAVKRSTSAKLEFVAGASSTQKLEFEITTSMVTDLQVILETEDGTRAVISDVSMFLKK